MSHIFMICLSVEGHLSGFHVPAIVNKAEMNIVEQVSVKEDVESFGNMPYSIVLPAGSYDRFIFSFFRSLHTDF